MSVNSWPGGPLGRTAVWRCLTGSGSRTWTSCRRAFVNLAGKFAALGCSGHSIFIFGFSNIPLHNSSSLVFGTPVHSLVSAGRWFKNDPELLNFLARSYRPALALSVDLFRYWGRMMWECVGVENRSPFTTEMGHCLRVGVHRVRRVSIAEGRFPV